MTESHTSAAPIPVAYVIAWLCVGAVAAMGFGLRAGTAMRPAPVVTTSPNAAPEGIAFADLPTAGRKSHHAATLVAGAQGQPIAFWFAGSREGASDVCILRSEFVNGRWSEAEPVLDAGLASALSRRWVVKLGNPVATRDAEGRLHLYVVSVTVGGWSGSRLLHFVSRDEGRTYASAEMVVLSPLLNVSTLVKSPALAGGDGVMLPVYHELATKRPLMVRLDDSGGVASAVRMGDRVGLLQPAVVPLRDGGYGCFLRHRRARPPRVQWQTSDDGDVWSHPTPLTIPNPNSAIAAAALPDGDIVLALNALDSNRNRLSLLVGDGRGGWREVCEPLAALVEVSYPALLAAPDALHVVCTYEREKIRHVRIPYAVLKQARADHPVIFPAPGAK